MATSRSRSYSAMPFQVLGTNSIPANADIQMKMNSLMIPFPYRPTFQHDLVGVIENWAVVYLHTGSANNPIAPLVWNNWLLHTSCDLTIVNVA
jgi:hypothetical protein